MSLNGQEQNPGLGELATRFLNSLPPDERKANRQEVYHFVRWYGWERPICELSIPGIGDYAEQVVLSTTDPTKKLEPVRAFLTYAHKEDLCQTNLAVHLRVKRGGAKPVTSAKQGLQESAPLTSQGYAELKSRLAALKSERPHIAEELRKAAADKDFRENAPLEAVREYQGQLEARIREVEATLKSAVVISAREVNTLKADIGNIITLRDLASGEELRYTLVSPSEANASQGKISSASPTGRALLGRGEKELIEVTAPAGKLCYQIERVEH